MNQDQIWVRTGWSMPVPVLPKIYGWPGIGLGGRSCMPGEWPVSEVTSPAPNSIKAIYAKALMLICSWPLTSWGIEVRPAHLGFWK